MKDDGDEFTQKWMLNMEEVMPQETMKPTHDLDRDNIIAFNCYAWVGEDELGSGEIGFKQMHMPCGLTPLVAIDRAKIDRGPVEQALTEQNKRYGKRIYLVRLYALEILKAIDHDAKTETSACRD